MNEQIEYIEPTQEHVGQMVEVKYADGNRWVQAKLTGILQDDFCFAAKRDSDTFSYAWRYARIPRPLTYAERQAKCGLKVGDRVKFLKAWDSDEYKHIECDSVMCKALVGTYGEVIGIGNHIQVQFPQHYGLSWFLPYFVLEKVEDRVATINDIGKQVYVEGTPGDVFKFEMIYGIEGDVWRAVVRSGDKRFVYELSNLRVKE